MRMIFDVESNGLHGEGFAVGWVIITDDGEIVCEGYEATPIENPDPWVAENVLPHLPEYTQKTARDVREAFWLEWMKIKDQGGSLWADCGWPVEARFLINCLADDPEVRAWSGPYPFHEIATVFTVAGWKGTDQFERLDNEPEHNPLGDARQSARLLLWAEETIKSNRSLQK